MEREKERLTHPHYSESLLGKARGGCERGETKCARVGNAGETEPLICTEQKFIKSVV